MIRDRLPAPVRRRLAEAHGSLRFHRRVVATFGAAAITRVVPASADPWVTERIARIFERARPSRIEVFEDRMCEVLTPDLVDPKRVPGLAREYLRMRIEVRWARSRGITRPDWAPEVHIDGLATLEAALEQGSGAVLWCMSFVDHFPRNVALSRHGHPAVHLSSAGHLVPPGRTDRWTRDVVAPVFRRAEDRPLLDRVEIQAGGSVGYLRELRSHLEANAVVSIVGDLTTGKLTIPARVGGLDTAVPTGAPSLARATGAALLPTVVVRDGPFRYRVVIEPDITPCEAASKDEFRRRAVEAFAERVEHHLAHHPSSASYWGTRA